MTTDTIDKAVLGLLSVGEYTPYGVIADRAKAAGMNWTGDALYDVLTRLVSTGPVYLTYGRGYFYPSPYDTGEVLEPEVWDPDDPVSGLREAGRYGRVDFTNDEGGTEVTVWVERTEDGPLVHVIGHADGVTVSEE